MKKIFFTLALSLILLVSGVSLVSAQTAASSPSGSPVQTKREIFRAKLQTVRDERKRKITENIDERLAKINTKWVNQWNKTLKRLGFVLDKIEDRAQKAQENGKDITKVEEAINTAREKIDEAQLAVDEQEDRDYVIELTDQNGEGIGRDVKREIAEFHADIRAVQAKVKAAKQAVVDVFQLLKTIVGEDAKEESN